MNVNIDTFVLMTPMHAAPIRLNEEIDLRELSHNLWAKRRFILFSSLLAFALATAYAYVLAKPTFESSALLLPTQAPSTDQLSAAAALLGKGSGSSGDVDLYQSLLTSRTVIHKLLLAPIQNESDTGHGRIEPMFQVLGLDTTKPLMVDKAVEGLAKSIVVDTKESGTGGLLEIKFAAGTPWLAQQIGTSVLTIGQEELRLVRIERSNVILSRLSPVVDQAKAEWESSARTLTVYKDQNRSIALPDQMLLLSRLEFEKDAKEQKYLLVRKEYDMQALESAKATPPMMILDPANLPSHKSKPKRLLIVILGTTIGVFIGVAGVIAYGIFNSSETRV
jgi:uncharacterized protein involved in exopolysaccharide biosynthesis